MSLSVANPSVSKPSEPKPEAAIEALRWAADVGEKSRAECPAPKLELEAKDIEALPLATFREQMDRLLLGRYPDQGLDALLEAGILEVWLPEISVMVGFGDGEWNHKDVWKHTKQVVWQSVRRLEIRWGALLHDIGKIKTRSIDEKGAVHFFAHSEVGAAMFRKRLAKRLGFHGAQYKRIHFLILHHLRASQYDGSWTDSAVRRFTKQMGEGLDDLLNLSRADITTKRPEKKKRGLRQISELAKRIEKLRIEDAKSAPLPKGLGTAMMETFSLPASKRLGDIKQAMEAAVEQGQLEAHQSIEFYMDWLKAHRDQFDL
ncbi:MAG: HDIG domain-containing protein [Myxococcales bacterium]|nr:MAG: HDIG domain-containing protein [Myxococcales bacterium]